MKVARVASTVQRRRIEGKAQVVGKSDKRRARNVGELRAMTDYALFSVYVNDTTSRAVALRVINERRGTNSILAWIKGIVDKPVPVPKTRSNETLRRELTAILNSGWDFSSLKDRGRCMEFCSDHDEPVGYVLNKYEKDLTRNQGAMLYLIRAHYAAWVRECE